MKKVLLAATVLALALAVAPAFGYVYINSTFTGDTVANPATSSYPAPKLWAVGGGLTTAQCADKVSVVDAAAEFTGETPPADIGHCVRFHDPVSVAATSNVNFSRSFAPTTTGTVTVTFDMRLAQTTSAFFIRMCNEGAITSGGSWANMLIFEGNQAWATPAAPGSISYMTCYASSGTYVKTTATYQANKWYTVKLELNLDTKQWRAFMGDKGSSDLPLIVDWVDFIHSATGATYTQVSKLQQIAFFTSTKAAPETDGITYIDNVHIEGNVAPLIFNTIRDARLADKGSTVLLSDKVVTSGTDETNNPYFYIQDDEKGGAGIRVRYFDAVVHEGDRVDVQGTLAQASDNGGVVNHNGEREITSEAITIHSSHDPAPVPIYVRNAQVGGGWLGPNETVTGGPEPRLKGVYPMNAYGDLTTYDATKNTFAPLFNTGTLVTVCGKITRVCAYDPSPDNPFDIYIDDGSLAYDGFICAAQGWDDTNHPTGLRIRINSVLGNQLPMDLYTLGKYVVVTGIAGGVSNSDISSGNGIRNIRVVRPRKVADVQILQ